ncbi:hypothetical protein SAMN04488239_13510 [Ruegeria marina]|uniref:Uncharacterized protein n=1 Tax=Ruegeria marina TaxID=639004 RepID=A0A1G7FIZ6_9RHOB|nr:hypothetical protein SAMN04488239_13510 [Ruegeria marina]
MSLWEDLRGYLVDKVHGEVRGSVEPVDTALHLGTLLKCTHQCVKDVGGFCR